MALPLNIWQRLICDYCQKTNKQKTKTNTARNSGYVLLRKFFPWNIYTCHVYFIISKLLNKLQINSGPFGMGCRIHRLHLCGGVRLPYPDMTLSHLSLVSWSCEIHRLHLYSGITFLQRCPNYDPEQSMRPYLWV